MGLQLDDVNMVLPEDGLKYGLQLYIGFLGLTLLAATKMAQTYRADVLIAFKMMAGAKPGLWWQRLIQTHALL
eukprot:3760399-Ditylum_brightwellii.AAC.2